jgi:hypothetical protein
MNADYHASFGQCRLCIYPLAMRLFKEKGYNLCIYPLAMRLFKEKGYNPAITGFEANRAASV